MTSPTNAGLVKPAVPTPRSHEMPAKADHRETQTGGEFGHVHSHDTASGVDGPGLRYVIWLMGCFFRCQYCHNPDMLTLPSEDTGLRADAVLDAVAKYRGFLSAAGGGVTVSGGEPLVQAQFALNLLRGAKRMGLHTALDTNGHLGDRLRDEDLTTTIDLVLLDLKAYGQAQHRRVTGVGNRKVLAFAERLAALNRPAWVRFVLVPGLTDEPKDIQQLARFISGLTNVERLEILPFHQMGQHKWLRLGWNYPLKDVPAAGPDSVEAVRAEFQSAGCPVR